MGAGEDIFSWLDFTCTSPPPTLTLCSLFRCLNPKSNIYETIIRFQETIVLRVFLFPFMHDLQRDFYFLFFIFYHEGRIKGRSDVR